MQVKKQQAQFVRSAKGLALFVFTEYSIDGALKSHAVVMSPSQMLLPRWKIGMGIEDEAWNLDAEAANAWLRAGAYEPLSPAIGGQ